MSIKETQLLSKFQPYQYIIFANRQRIINHAIKNIFQLTAVCNQLITINFVIVHAQIYATCFLRPTLSRLIAL